MLVNCWLFVVGVYLSAGTPKDCLCAKGAGRAHRSRQLQVALKRPAPCGLWLRRHHGTLAPLRLAQRGLKKPRWFPSAAFQGASVGSGRQALFNGRFGVLELLRQVVRQLLEQLGVQAQFMDPGGFVKAGDLGELVGAEVQAGPVQVFVAGEGATAGIRDKATGLGPVATGMMDAIDSAHRELLKAGQRRARAWRFSASP